MDSLATPEEVRLRFQLPPELPASDAINAAIAEAGLVLAGRADPGRVTPPLPDAFRSGAILLAGAFLFRSLAAGDAHEQRDLHIGGQRIAPGKRFGALLALAEQAEAEAWERLAPWLKPAPPRPPAAATDGAPLFGAPRGE